MSRAHPLTPDQQLQQPLAATSRALASASVVKGVLRPRNRAYISIYSEEPSPEGI